MGATATMAMFLFFLCLTVVLAQSNSTDSDGTQCPATAPGMFYRGSCNLLCQRASWSDVLIFYLGNYVAHAATIVSQPGQSVVTTIVSIILAFLFPSGGVVNAVHSILNCPKFASTDLQVAARAGALYAVVSSDEIRRDTEPAGQQTHASQETVLAREAPRPGQQAEDLEMQSQPLDAPPRPSPAIHSDAALLQLDGSYEADEAARVADSEFLPLKPRQEFMKLMAPKIHGRCRLPEGYELMRVPKSAKFVGDSPPQGSFWRQHVTSWFRPEPAGTTTISCSYNIVKIIVSIVQLCYGIATLYRTRGNQLDQYGYAAFGLTVAPYAWMTMVNLVANIVCPQYEVLYIVESSGLRLLRERLARGSDSERAQFEVQGTMGRLTGESNRILLHDYDEYTRGVTALVAENTGNRMRYLVKWYKLQLKSPERDLDLTAISRYLSAGKFGPITWQNMYITNVVFWVATVPLVIIGAISRFQPGQSNLYQRLWVMLWIVGGISCGCFTVSTPVEWIEGRPLPGRSHGAGTPPRFIMFILFVSSYSCLSVGGYVVVGQMITSFGTCTRLDAGGSMS